MNKHSFRLWSLLGFLGLFAIFVLARYAYLAATPTKNEAPVAAEIDRGAISDRGGRVLAMDSPLYDVAVWRPETKKESFPQEAAKLAAITGTSEAEILDRWSSGNPDFFYVTKRASPQVARAIQEAKDGGSFSGVVVEKVAGRLYPEKRLASHLVGFVGDGNMGLAGVEKRCEDELLMAPTDNAQNNGAKDKKAKASPDTESASLEKVGRSVVLTIDADIQFSLEEIARKAMTTTGAESVIILAVDPRSGEVLAYVAMPDFDPNDYASSPESSWYDWPSVYHYEPGSVFKVFTMASVVDLGGATASTTFYCDGAFHKVAPSGEKITIKCLDSHGYVNIQKILEFSCNAGAAYAADSVDSVDFYAKLRAFGFGSRTGILVPSETPGLLSSPESWSLRSKPTIGMGQELSVSAIQMAQAATAIANGGVLMKSYVVKRVLEADGSVAYENEPQSVRHVVSADTAKMILSAMETVSGAGGTGTRAKVADVRMAVKTGTAQMIDPETQRYSEKDYIASTIAIFPADDPRMIVYLAIVKPTLGPSYYGGRIAAPLVKEAAEAILNVTGMPRGANPVVVHPGEVALPAVKAVTIGDTMPDLAGVPKRLLMPLLSRKDITLSMKGEGYVVSQSPAPGSPIGPGAAISLEFK
jgi:cell division protein FtsI (penicillin-binding protein 3)